jgi:sigma-B regulation protein RsbU (phosphoserine phosphatase)
MNTQQARPPFPAGPRAPWGGESLPRRAGRFWLRVSDGMKLEALWKQLRTDARTTYRLYSREIDAVRPAGAPRRKHFIQVARQFFWAIMDKLTPARRILLLLALVMLFLPQAEMTGNPSQHWEFRFEAHLTGGLLMFGLLLLELTDRVVMKRDLQIAKEIQAWLLPSRPPQVPGLEIAFATRPANTVAGDYYDVFPRRGLGGEAGNAPADESFLIVVADVAGKSVPAAMLMATIQASLRTLSMTPGSLLELVARMNRYVCSNSQNGRRFTTAFLGEYEQGSRALRYVNAGHNAPVLRRRSGITEELKMGGMPLGVMEGAVYESGAVTLERGDLLVAFTDGLVEAENARAEEYGEGRFLALLRAKAEAPTQAILRSVLEDIDRFVGTAPQHDDVTLMVLKAI